MNSTTRSHLVGYFYKIYTNIYSTSFCLVLSAEDIYRSDYMASHPAKDTDTTPRITQIMQVNFLSNSMEQIP